MAIIAPAKCPLCGQQAKGIMTPRDGYSASYVACAGCEAIFTHRDQVKEPLRTELGKTEESNADPS